MQWRRIKWTLVDESRKLKEKGARISMNRFRVSRSRHGHGLITMEDPFLPPEIFLQVAYHLSSMDQLTLRLLSKDIKAILPKIFLLNLKHFSTSFYKFITDRKALETNTINGENLSIPVNFKLNPLEIKKDPFSSLLDKSVFSKCLSTRFRFLLFFIGDRDIEAAILRVYKSKGILPYLQIAAYFNCATALELLLTSKDAPALTEVDCKYALDFSCQVGCDKILNYLLELHDPRFNPSQKTNTPIQLVAGVGNSTGVRILLADSRVYPAAGDNLAIRRAAYFGRTEAFLLLLQDGRTDPSDANNECISSASRLGFSEMVSVLLADHRIDASAKNFEALKLARKNGHQEAITLLQEHFIRLGVNIANI